MVGFEPSGWWVAVAWITTLLAVTLAIQSAREKFLHARRWIGPEVYPTAPKFWLALALGFPIAVIWIPIAMEIVADSLGVTGTSRNVLMITSLVVGIAAAFWAVTFLFDFDAYSADRAADVVRHEKMQFERWSDERDRRETEVAEAQYLSDFTEALRFETGECTHGEVAIAIVNDMSPPIPSMCVQFYVIVHGSNGETCHSAVIDVEFGESPQHATASFCWTSHHGVEPPWWDVAGCTPRVVSVSRVDTRQ